jgi:hypothetical protein
MHAMEDKRVWFRLTPIREIFKLVVDASDFQATIQKNEKNTLVELCQPTPSPAHQKPQHVSFNFQLVSGKIGEICMQIKRTLKIPMQGKQTKISQSKSNLNLIQFSFRRRRLEAPPTA